MCGFDNNNIIVVIIIIIIMIIIIIFIWGIPNRTGVLIEGVSTQYKAQKEKINILNTKYMRICTVLKGWPVIFNSNAKSRLQGCSLNRMGKRVPQKGRGIKKEFRI